VTRRGVNADTDRAVPGPGAALARVAAVLPEAAAEPSTVEEHLLHGSRIGVLACDQRGVVRSANPAALRLLPGLASARCSPCSGSARRWPGCCG
jgi:hypothetical protein